MEKRNFEIKELRAETQDGVNRIGGHAAVFEQLSDPFFGGMFREKIAKGAFAQSLQESDIRALWSHNPDYVLGRNRSGSLRLKEDEVGLSFELDLPDTQWGRDAFTLIKRGDVTGMSFGFFVKAQEFLYGDDGEETIRTLKQVELLEISPTAFPAYPQTDVSVRSFFGESEERAIKEAFELHSASRKECQASIEKWTLEESRAKFLTTYL